MNDILVSICCLTYNHANYIRECIEGFLAQKTKFKYEILIHDDASTDITQDIIREYEKKYPDIIKPIYQKENQDSKGVAISATLQFTRAKGKYIALCEGDDYWTDPLKLQKQVDFMEAHPDYTMCFHGIEEIDNKGNHINNYQPYTQNQESPLVDIVLNGGLFCPTVSLLLKKEILNDYPDFCLKCHVGDYPLQIWCAVKGKVYYINELFGVYRKGDNGSWTKRFSKLKLKEKYAKLETELNMLLSFDKLTEYKYSNAFQRRYIHFCAKNKLFLIMKKHSSFIKHEPKLRRRVRRYLQAYILGTFASLKK